MNPTEKGMVSFFLGQVQAKIFAEDVLGLDYFAHYESYLLASGRAMNKSRPDFIGFDRGGRVFVNVEAKGRYGASISGVEKSRAKSQVRRMGLGSTAAVEHSYVHVGHFPKEFWVAELHDPPPGPTNMILDRGLGIFLHYWPLVAAFIDRRETESTFDENQTPAFGEAPYVFREFPEVGIAIGIPVGIFEVVSGIGQGWIKSRSSAPPTDGILDLAAIPPVSLNRPPERFQNRDVSYGKDSVICVLLS
jgi:hypothetical protein